jgi:large subunit ribosomal protein L18
MKKNNISLFRRKREGKTHYKKRLKILLSNKFRLVLRKSLNSIKASIVQYDAKGDRILFTVDSKTLGKFGWKGNTGNLPSAYLTGMIAGKKAVKEGVKEAILDIGLNNSTKGSRLYAALAGAIDAGMKIPSSMEVLPSIERISGDHISKYAKSIKNDKSRYEKQFYDYIKKGINPEDIVKHFNEIKEKINE